jgi:predicted ABC-type ATPase
VLAGANGVGKTTFAHANLQAFVNQEAFLNADDIARQMDSSDVDSAAIEAGRRLLRRRRLLLDERQSFCIETTLATRTLLRFIAEAQRIGYRVEFIFLFTPLPNVNELRVKQRVMKGGHNIDTDTIRRRHALGLKYLMQYWEACDAAIVFDAQSLSPLEVARKDDGGTHVTDSAGWALLMERIEVAGGARSPLA